MAIAQAGSPDDDPGRRVRHALERLAALSAFALPSDEFFEKLLRTALGGIGAAAGAVWTKSPQGLFLQQCQRSLAQVGLDDRPDGRQAHNQLLRFAFEIGKPGILGPRQRAEGDRSAGNLTEYFLAVAPILSRDDHMVGLVEVFHEPRWHPQDLVTYTIRVAEYASSYVRGSQ